MRWVATIVVSLVAGFAGAALFSFSGLGGNDTREYLMAHPEVLPEAIQQLQRKEMASTVAPLRPELETPFPGAVLGNPKGSVTLVEFSDYACGYCRQSLAEVEALIAANPDLKVVIREYPILSSGSVDAARMALAAAQQGKYAAFHKAMFEGGSVSPEAIGAAASRAELDMAKAQQAIDSGAFDATLQANVALANTLNLSGTPGFVVGDALFDGAVGRDLLTEAIETARAS